MKMFVGQQYWKTRYAMCGCPISCKFLTSRKRSGKQLQFKTTINKTNSYLSVAKQLSLH